MRRTTAAEHGDTWTTDAAASAFLRPRMADSGDVAAAPRVGASRAAEIAYLNGVTAAGTLTRASYWGDNGQTAYKWGAGTLGTGATITYAFDPRSNFTPNETATFLKAFAMWSSVADVTFVAASSKATANVVLRRGHDGGAYTSEATTLGSGATLGHPSGQATISIDSSVKGFELDGSFAKVGGYALSSVIHEVGHLLGLGHGGNYNGDVVARTDQLGAYDDRMYTIMSYISWADTDARYQAKNPYQGTDWGRSTDGYQRQAPHSIMQLDIQAIQQLYGVAKASPFTGGQTYGFHSNIAGPLHDFFDFSVNTDPVLTLYNQGTGNTLDVSGYATAQRIDLRPGAFSDIGGHVNNIAVAEGTLITTAIGGAGADAIRANDSAGVLDGRGGDDVLTGGVGRDLLEGGDGADRLVGGRGIDRLEGDAGGDTFAFLTAQDCGRTAARCDAVLDFGAGDRIDLSAIDAVTGAGDNAFAFIGQAAFSGTAGELRLADSSTGLILSGDVNGDGVGDLFVRLAGVHTITADLLVL